MQGREVQGILGIGNYQARTQDITDCTVCRNPKIAYHIMLLRLIRSLVQRVRKPMMPMEITAELSEMLVCTKGWWRSCLGISDELYINTVSTPRTNAREYKKGNSVSNLMPSIHSSDIDTVNNLRGSSLPLSLSPLWSWLQSCLFQRLASLQHKGIKGSRGERERQRLKWQATPHVVTYIASRIFVFPCGQQQCTIWGEQYDVWVPGTAAEVWPRAGVRLSHLMEDRCLCQRWLCVEDDLGNLSVLYWSAVVVARRVTEGETRLCASGGRLVRYLSHPLCPVVRVWALKNTQRGWIHWWCQHCTVIYNIYRHFHKEWEGTTANMLSWLIHY